MRSKSACLAIALIGVVAAACAPPASEDPELILTDGLIYPLGADDDPVEALAIRGDDILAMGADADMLQLAGDYTQQMSLEGTAILPGAYDAWIDLEALGRWNTTELDMRLASSLDEVQAMVRNAAGGSADTGWLVGWGWDENEWPEPSLPDRGVLDATGVTRRIVLMHRNERAAWLNGAALEALAQQLDGRTGLLRDDSGAPTGIVLGEALAEVREAIAGDTDQRRAWLAEGARSAAAGGITRAATSPTDGSALEELLELEFRGLLPVRVDVRLTPAAARAYAAGEVPRRLADSTLVRVVGVGVRLDGPLASRLALLSEPYAVDAPELPPLDVDGLQAAAAAARAAGLPLHLHASGDAAVGAALELVTTADLPASLIAGFDLLPADMPTDLDGVHVGLPLARFQRDVYALERLLGAERAERAHAWGNLWRTGATLRVASDAPAYQLRPLSAVAAGLTRQDAQGYPAGGWNPSQALPRAALLRALVADGAGLAPGESADLVAWSENPVVGDATALRRAEALLTIVAGRVAYSRALVTPPTEGEQRR